jgi:hypothetical protein
MSSVPPSQSGVPPSGGNNKTYIVLVVVLLLGIGGLVAYKFSGGGEGPKPATTTTVASVASSAPTNNPALDDIPPPPPVIEAGPAPTVVYSGGGGGDPCAYNVCNGNVASGSDTERGLQLLAHQTRRKCYDPALANDPTLQGHVKLKMKIASNGTICSASVLSNDMPSGSVGECAARMLQSSGHVPPPKGGCVNLDFPLNYVPMGQH